MRSGRVRCFLGIFFEVVELFDEILSLSFDQLGPLSVGAWEL